MGSRGPKPTPSRLHLLRGNPSKKAVGDLVEGFSPPVEIPSCPKHLMPSARAEWRRITQLLWEVGLIAKIDRATLAIYCAAVAWWEWHEQHLLADIESASKARSEWESKPENSGKPWAGGDGFMLPTPNGSVTYNPHWVGKNKAAEQIDKFAANFGGAAAFRARVTPSSNYPYLPGMEPETQESDGKQKITSLLDFAQRSK